MNEYNNINLDDNSSKPKKHTFRKAAAFLMAMVLVSGGSVAVYRGVFESPTSAVEETSKTESNNKSSLAAESVLLKQQMIPNRNSQQKKLYKRFFRL